VGKWRPHPPPPPPTHTLFSCSARSGLTTQATATASSTCCGTCQLPSSFCSSGLKPTSISVLSWNCAQRWGRGHVDRWAGRPVL
jgi:hypothetical protein